MPLNHIFRKCTGAKKLHISQEKINHLMYIDDIKLSAKNEKELETLVPALKIYSYNIGMKFGIEKCTMLIMKSRKQQMMERIEQPNQRKIRMLGEKETYKYLGIFKVNIIKQVEMKEKIKNEQENYSKPNYIARISSKG